MSHLRIYVKRKIIRALKSLILKHIELYYRLIKLLCIHCDILAQLFKLIICLIYLLRKPYGYWI